MRFLLDLPVINEIPALYSLKEKIILDGVAVSMQKQTVSLEEALEIAEKAKAHAREHIKAGGTQLENNDLCATWFNCLLTGINDLREAKDEKIEKQACSDRLETIHPLISYETMISFSSKYSIGNCRELAAHAFDYVLNDNHRPISAIMYFIKGGDHTFLVLNVKPDCKPEDISTWGDNAVICDPWANKVYKASDYKLELKNFYHKKNGRKKENCIEDFDENKHKLVPVPFFNTDFLRQIRRVDTLMNNFIAESSLIVSVFTVYKERLEEEKNRLIVKYGEDNAKAIILEKKIQLIEATLADVNGMMDSIQKENHDDYRKTRTELNEALKKMRQSMMASMPFTKEERDSLFAHQGKDRKSEVMNFLGMQTKTEEQLKNISVEVNALLLKPRI